MNMNVLTGRGSLKVSDLSFYTRYSNRKTALHIMGPWMIMMIFMQIAILFPMGSALTFCSLRTNMSMRLNYHQMPILTRKPWRKGQQHTTIHRSRLTMISDENDTAVKAETKGIAEGFGVTEKNIEFRDMLESNDEIDINVPEADLVEPKELITSADSKSKNAPTINPKTVIKFMAPTLALWIAPPVMSLIDTSVVGLFCGPLELAALSPGCTLIDSSSYLFMFIATAATNMVSSLQANKDIEESEQIVSEALFLALCSGLFLASMVFVAGRPILLAISGKESAMVVPSALKYATIRAFAQPAVVMASVARAASLARKDTKGPLISVAIAFVLNVIGTVGLVRGTHLGIMGAAIGTLCADCMATTFLLLRIRQNRKRNAEENEASGGQTSTKITPLIKIPNMASFRKFWRYALPIFFTILGKSVVYNGVAMSVGRLGSVALAAHQVLLRSFFFWTPVGDSVGMTSQVFLPGILAEERRTGTKNRGAKRLLFVTGAISGLCAAAAAGWLPVRGAGLFTTDAAVKAALRTTAPILGISVLMHAVALTCEGMLLAMRDLKFLSGSYVITTIATIALLLSTSRPATLQASWWILAGFQGIRAFQFAIRSVWLSRRRITQE